MKKATVAVVLLCLVVAGLFWWKKTRAEAVPAEEAPTFEAVKRGPIRQVVQSTGRIVSNLDVEIKCRASGEVIDLPHDVSDEVKKDDLLLELDPVEQERAVEIGKATTAASEARLAQAESNLITTEATLKATRIKVEAALKSAQARVADSKAKAQREKELLAKKYSSAEEAETADTAAIQAEQDLQNVQGQLADLQAQEVGLEAKRQDVKLAKAQLNSSQIDLALRQRQLTYTKVYAPIDGVVSTRAVQKGQIISSGVTNVGGGTTVMTLSDLSHIYILASVDESNIGVVELGQEADITVDAFPGQRFRGKVDRIATKGVSLSNVVTFEVRIEVMSKNKKLLKPEMTANVWILIAEKPDTLLVSAYSITRDQRDTYVELKKPDGTTDSKHVVKTGITDGVETEILEGLKEGDMVLVQSPAMESRWRNGGDNSPARDKARRDRMMMRTMGGGAPTGGRR
jgi:HlyD family secretion protein